MFVLDSHYSNGYTDIVYDPLRSHNAAVGGVNGYSNGGGGGGYNPSAFQQPTAGAGTNPGVQGEGGSLPMRRRRVRGGKIAIEGCTFKNQANR